MVTLLHFLLWVFLVWNIRTKHAVNGEISLCITMTTVCDNFGKETVNKERLEWTGMVQNQRWVCCKIWLVSASPAVAEMKILNSCFEQFMSMGRPGEEFSIYDVITNSMWHLVCEKEKLSNLLKTISYHFSI